MSNILNFYTIAAFILGVFLSGAVMKILASAKSKATGG